MDPYHVTPHFNRREGTNKTVSLSGVFGGTPIENGAPKRLRDSMQNIGCQRVCFKVIRKIGIHFD